MTIPAPPRAASCCGRPFLVGELPRLADVTSRSDWLETSLSPNLAGLSALQRAELGAHWARFGQMEHASIAAFARFNLQLLSLGAPSELLEACNRALADETTHARLCFALASHYGGTAVGPARLNVEHCLEDNGLSAIVKLVLREGCIGETVAAFEALEAAALASDPAVKSALQRIARDERAHAELAFKFVRWALGQAAAEVRDELGREAMTQLEQFESAALNRERVAGQESLVEHGVLGGQTLQVIHLSAVRDIVGPLLLSILLETECV